jgi:membrane protein YqaA with SNARE-associated domain
MDFELVRESGWFVGTFGYCLAAGLIPFLNTEAFLLWLAVSGPRAELLPLLLVACLGHMVAKSALFGAGRGIFRKPVSFENPRFERVRVALAGRAGSTWFTFVSALTGFPPFYWFSLAAGVLRWRFVPFLIGGLAGRAVRFAAVLYLPQGLGW